MEISDQDRIQPSVSLDIDSDEAIARQLHELEIERAAPMRHERDPLSFSSSGRILCINRRMLQWAYFVYLILEFAAMIPVMIISSKERFMCEHSNLRVWIVIWESRVLLALPIAAVKLCTRHRSFTFELINAMLSIYILVLFFWGNLLLLSPGASSCYVKAPVSLAFVVTVLAVVYAYLAIPLALMTLFCICLPIYAVASSLIKPRDEHLEENPIDMATLQTRKYTTQAETQNENAKCAICMNDFVPNESLITTLPCGHEFDRECIEYWLSIKKQCAVCRQELDPNLRVEVPQPAS